MQNSNVQLKNTRYAGIILLGAVSVFTHLQAKPEEQRITVEVTEENREAAERMAKRRIVEEGLGSYVKSHSMVIDARSMGFVIENSTAGLVRSFRVEKEDKKNGSVYLKASGIVSESAMGDAVEEMYSTIGKPRILAIVNETVANKQNASGSTVTESRFVAGIPGLEFVDAGQMEKIIAKNKNVTLAYDNPAAQKAALDAAVEENCEILLLVKTQVSQGSSVSEDSEMKTINGTISYKLIDVNTARILAANTEKGGRPHIDLEQGSVGVIGMLVEKVSANLKEQLASKWKRGNTIRVVFRGIDYDTYMDLELGQAIRSLRGVNAVQERGKSPDGSPILEVECLFSGGVLYKKMREMRETLKIDFKSRDVKNNLIDVTVIEKK